VLGVKLGPIFFGNTVIGFEIAPHFGMRMRGDDGDLRDVELERSKDSQVGGDGFRSLWRQANDVVALSVEAGTVEALGKLEGGLNLFVFVHLLEDVLMKALDAEESAFHTRLPPLIKIAEEEIDAGLHKPVNFVAGEKLDNLFGVSGKIAKVFVEDEDKVDAVLDVKTQNTIDGIKSDFLGMRGEGRSLTKGAAKTATARRKKDADGKRPTTGEVEFSDERRVLDLVEGGAEELGEFLFTVAGEDVIEVGVDGRSQGAVVPCPELRNASATSFPGHGKNVVGLFEIERKADRVPTKFEEFGIFRPGGILQNGEARKILLEEPETEGDLARHAKPPAEVARSVFAEVIVQASIAATGGEEDARQNSLPQTNGTRAGPGTGRL
jgi:hypothetical protein